MINLKADAALAGFDVEVVVPSRRKRIFLRAETDAGGWDYGEAARHCAELGGILAQEYDKETVEAISAALSDDSTKRYVLRTRRIFYGG